jgi:hypothetical protein
MLQPNIQKPEIIPYTPAPEAILNAPLLTIHTTINYLFVNLTGKGIYPTAMATYNSSLSF